MARHAGIGKARGNRAAGGRQLFMGHAAPGLALMLAVVAMGGLVGLAPAAAQSAIETPVIETPPRHSVTGFRTARFGDDEPAVRAAIAADFGIGDDAIARIENPVEATTVLQVRVDDLLLDSGTASISYIFGYQSKALVQINLSWGPPADMEAEPSQVVNTAQRLGSYFLGLGFVAETVVANQQLPNGNVRLFRGADVEGRLVEMQLTLLRPPPPAEGEEGEEPPPPRMALLLSYVADPENPDVFTIEKGTF